MKPSEALEKMKYTYYDFEKKETNNKRKYNIESYTNIIGKQIKDDNLYYNTHEQFICIYETEYDEKIGIQYPGKQNILDAKERKPFDSRPKIFTKDNIMVEDLNFNNLYDLIEDLHDNKNLFPVVLAMIFRMGFMIDNILDEKYCDIYDTYGGAINATANEPSKKIKFKHYHFDFKNQENEVMEYLNSQYEKVNVKAHDKNIKNKISISFEAFMCFFDLLFQTEDIKYNYDCLNDLKDAGRMPTAKSAILFGGIVTRDIRTALAMQRFIRGRGTGNCKNDEIEKFTKGEIKVIKVKPFLLSKLDELNVDYQTSGSITVNNTPISGIKLKTHKIMLLNQNNYDKYKLEEPNDSTGWKFYNFESRELLENLENLKK